MSEEVKPTVVKKQRQRLNSRAVYRWKNKETSSTNHGGGGGKNRITPLEEKRIVTLAKKFPAMKCRRIAYELERKSLAFIGKTKVAEVLLKHGLNHEFIRGKKKEVVPPAELLLHEPWAKNLFWGMDWTYFRIAISVTPARTGQVTRSPGPCSLKSLSLISFTRFSVV